MTFSRILKPVKESFFLFWPTATGKSTWLLEVVKPDYSIDLLKSKEFLRFSKHPEDLRDLIEANRSFELI